MMTNAEAYEKFVVNSPLGCWHILDGKSQCICFEEAMDLIAKMIDEILPITTNESSSS